MSSSSRFEKGQVIFDAQAANGSGTSVRCSDFRHLVVFVATANSADMTLTCVGSLQDLTPPDWDSAQAVGNEWTEIGIYDLNDATIVAGTTGIAPGGTDIYKMYLINVDGLDWINFTVSSYVAGNATIKVKTYSNL